MRILGILVVMLCMGQISSYGQTVPDVPEAVHVQTNAEKIKEHYDAQRYDEMWAIIEEELASPNPAPVVKAFTAWLYERGNAGVDKNISQAITLYTEAALTGDIKSYAAVARCYRNHEEGRLLPHAESIGEEWRSLGAKMGDPVLQASVGQALLGNGYASTEEKRAGFELLKAAAEGNQKLNLPGNGFGMFHLGILYKSGEPGVVQPDPVKSFLWTDRAARTGHYQAAHLLSVWHEKGQEGYPVDPVKTYFYRYLNMLMIDGMQRQELRRLRGLIIKHLKGDAQTADASIARVTQEAEKAAESFPKDPWEYSPLHR